MSSDFSREAALTALERCRRGGTWSSAAIDAAITEYKLEGRAAALSANIFLGVLQNMTLCDYYIDAFSTSAKIEPKVRDILRMAVYQLVFMEKIPQNAAVNEAVRLCKELGFARASGFVNAVLRKLAANIPELPEIKSEDRAEYLAIKYSHPKWLADELIDSHGYGFTEKLFAADNTAPETSIQVNTLKTSTGELLDMLSEAGVHAERHAWLPDCLNVKGNIKRMPGFEDGLFYVQDPAARSVVFAADVKPGMKLLDACAAPGGKSFAAAIAMKNAGSILSCDLHEKKLRLIDDGGKRLGIDIIKTRAADAREPISDKYDIVIADVPCSGYGVIRKKPEIRCKPENERHGLPHIQSEIFDNLSKCVMRGGVLIYSTCTIFHEENRDIVEAFLETHSEYESEDFTLPNGKTSVNGMMDFWQHIDGTDGFFVAKLRRKM